MNAVARAQDEDQFLRAIATALSDLEFDVKDVEDVKPFDEVTRPLPDESQLDSLAENVRANGGVQFGSFFSFPLDDV